jgi:hypothetical protein
METQDPAIVFSGRCTTFDVNCHGIRLISSRPFPYNTKLRLTIPPSNRVVTAYVVRSIPNLPAIHCLTWFVGIEFDTQGNYWDGQLPLLEDLAPTARSLSRLSKMSYWPQLRS